MTFDSNLAAQQALALNNSAELNRDGDVLTGQLQIATARLVVPTGYDDTATARLCYIPGGCRIIQQLCTAVASDGTAAEAGTLFLGEIANVIMNVGGNTALEDHATLRTTTGTWVSITFTTPSNLSDGDTMEFNIVYASSK